MPSRRVTALVLIGLGCMAAAIAGWFLFSRDDTTPVHGDLIAYGCREKRNPWYAICIVRSDGTVGDIRLQRGLGAGLDQRAIEAVRQWRFAPATRLGTPVDVLVEVAVEFKLR